MEQNQQLLLKLQMFETHCKQLESEIQTQIGDINRNKETIRDLQHFKKENIELNIKSDDLLQRKTSEFENLRKDLELRVPSLEHEI